MQDYSTAYTTVSGLFEREHRQPRALDPTEICLQHVISPVGADSPCSLQTAQSVTFAALTLARKIAGTSQLPIHVRQTAVQFLGDQIEIPTSMDVLSSLDRSALQIARFQKPRRLPLLWDVLQHADGASHLRRADCERRHEYLIYTNIDISPMPHFYLFIYSVLRFGYDSLIINRRTVPNIYKEANDLPIMSADIGKPHPGLDCFIFKRDLIRRFVPFRSVVGMGFVMRALLFNLIATSRKISIITDAHATFHLGDDKSWEDSIYADYIDFNKAEALAVWRAQARDPDIERRLKRFAQQTGEGWLPQSMRSQAPPWRFLDRMRRLLNGRSGREDV